MLDYEYLTFADSMLGKPVYGQTGYISGLYLSRDNSFHPLYWTSHKQSRICSSSVGVEILAGAYSVNRRLLMHTSVLDIYAQLVIETFKLVVDSFELYGTVKTLREGNDYRLRPTVSRIRGSLECREITTLRWISGRKNLADCLTKYNQNSQALLNHVMNTLFLDDSLFVRSHVLNPI